MDVTDFSIKNFVEMRNDQTLQMAVDELGLLAKNIHKANEWNSYLVVNVPNAHAQEERFRIDLFCNVAALLNQPTYPKEALPDLRLSAIPIPPPTGVYLIDDKFNPSELEDRWKNGRIGDTFVLYDEDGFFCLLVTGGLGEGAQTTFEDLGLRSTPPACVNKTCVKGHSWCYSEQEPSTRCHFCGVKL